MSYARYSSKSIKPKQLSFTEQEEAVEDRLTEPFSEPKVVEEEIKVVSVVLARNKIVKVTGKVTGRIYLFTGAGCIIDDVDSRDAEFLVNQPLPPSCCGSIPTPQFQIIGR